MQLYRPNRLVALSIAHTPTSFHPLISLGVLPFRHMHVLTYELNILG